ncbi:MAG: aldo/keto reductase [Acidobacteriota bacterium]
MMPEFARLGGGTPAVRRLGLATRGNGRLDPADVLYAIERGVNYLNWCAHPDGMSRAIHSLSPAERRGLVIAAQFSERSAAGFLRELDDFLQELGLDYIDAATFYYVESEAEWGEIAGPGGALQAARRAQVEGRIRLLGITTHQRPLAAERARQGELDLLMIRYNAAHRGAEGDVFPVTAERGTSVIAFTALRWRALLGPTRLDPPGVAPPQPVDCYRFVLSNPHVSVVLAAPGNRAELESDLALLDNWRELTGQEHSALCDHGDRVRQTAGRFP